MGQASLVQERSCIPFKQVGKCRKKSQDYCRLSQPYDLTALKQFLEWEYAG